MVPSTISQVEHVTISALHKSAESSRAKMHCGSGGAGTRKEDQKELGKTMTFFKIGTVYFLFKQFNFLEISMILELVNLDVPEGFSFWVPPKRAAAPRLGPLPKKIRSALPLAAAIQWGMTPESRDAVTSAVKQFVCLSNAFKQQWQDYSFYCY